MTYRISTGSNLTLTLLVLRIAADDPNDTFTLNDLAVTAHLFDGRTNFHDGLP